MKGPARRSLTALVAALVVMSLVATPAPTAGARISLPKVTTTPLPVPVPSVLSSSTPDVGGTLQDTTNQLNGSTSSSSTTTDKKASSTTTSGSSTAGSTTGSGFSGYSGTGDTSTTPAAERHFLKSLHPTHTACCPGNPALSSAVSKLDALIVQQDQLGALIGRLRIKIHRLRRSASTAMDQNGVLLSRWGFVGVALAGAVQSGVIVVPSQARAMTRYVARLQTRQAKLNKVQSRLDEMIAANHHKMVRLQKRIKTLRSRETTAQQLQQATLSPAIAPLRGYAAHPAPAPDKQIKVAMHSALAQLGKPYVWGAAGPSSFDCSGLTMFAWGKAGIALPHNAAAQASVLRHVPYDQMQPGDLLFYENPIGHVAMYIGNGQMIEAPHTGAFVRVVPVRTTDLVEAGRP